MSKARLYIQPDGTAMLLPPDRRSELIEKYVGCILTGWASLAHEELLAPLAPEFARDAATRYADVVIAATTEKKES